MVTKGYGLTVDDIDWSCPADLQPYADTYILSQKIKDEEMWRMGLYTYSAVATAVEHNLAGKKAKSSYIKKPFMQDKEILKNKEIPEEKRKEMENYKLAMSLKIMQANFELHKSRE